MKLWTTPMIVALAAVALLTPVAQADATTYLGCGYTSDFSFDAKPSACFLDWPNLSLAGAVSLRRIKWSSWGGRAATARAVFHSKDFEPWHRARVRASGRRICGGIRLYTMVRVSSGGVVHTWRTAPCSSTTPEDRTPARPPERIAPPEHATQPPG
jgi:hypothetical protein